MGVERLNIKFNLVINYSFKYIRKEERSNINDLSFNFSTLEKSSLKVKFSKNEILRSKKI